MAIFTAGQVEALLAKAHRIASTKRPTFAARLKHLQRLGVPARVNPGRGRSSVFDFSQVMQIAVTVELLQVGFPPTLAAEMVRRNWFDLRHTIWIATFNQAEALRLGEPLAGIGDLYWVIHPEVLQEMTEEGFDAIDLWTAIDTIPAVEIGEYIARPRTRIPLTGTPDRRVLLNATEITRSILLPAMNDFLIGTAEDLRSDLGTERQREQAALDKAVEAMGRGEDWSGTMEAAIEVMNLRPVFGWTDQERLAAAAAIHALTEPQRDLIFSLLHGGDMSSIDKDQLSALRQLGLLKGKSSVLELTDAGVAVASEIKRKWQEEKDVDPEA